MKRSSDGGFHPSYVIFITVCSGISSFGHWPRGESYFDILSRLDPLVHEMESYKEPLLIVSHQAVLRCLYAYLMNLPRG